MVTSACACAGIVVGVMGITGGGFKFINLITSFVDGNLMLLFVLLMITCFIVGMGVPTAPAYIIVSVLAAAAMIKLGVDPMAANLFVSYYAVLSAITPPVCLAAFAAASIAGVPAMKTGFQAVKLGAIAFIVPFFFVYEPALLLQGEWFNVTLAIISGIIGLIALTSGQQGFLFTNMALWERCAMVAGGILLILPGEVTDITGFILFLAVFFYQRLMQGKRENLAKAPKLSWK